MTDLRIATFNVRHGRGADDQVDLGRYVRAVGDLGADILALQEVDQYHLRSHRADLSALAAQAAGAVSWRFVPAQRRRCGRWVRVRSAWEARTQGSVRYGNALICRYPVSAWWRFDLPRAFPWRDEPRVAVAARVQAPDGPLTVVATHLTARPGATASQLAVFLRWAQSLPGPLVVLGDLNLAPQDVAENDRWVPLATALTHPVHHPVRQIDHILTSGGLRVARPARSVDTGLSDHRALVVDVRFA